MKKISMLCMVFFLLCMSFASKSYAEGEDQPGIIGQYGVSIDAKTGDVYYDKGANEPAYPASMTKLLTAIIIDETMKDDEKIDATPDAIGTECSCYGLEKDEKLSKSDALHALMIKSANDVSVAVAEHIGGSIKDFAKIMNKRAKEIGVSDNTNFVTPNGLTDVNHHVTPHDMALILREAIKHPAILDAMKASEYTVKSNKKEVVLGRHDSIFKIPHAVGGKTGFTNAAGNTLAVYYKDGDKEVITVVMKSNPSGHYSDSKTMSEYAFDRMDVSTIIKKGDSLKEVKVDGKTVHLLAKDEFSLTHPKDKKPHYTIKTTLEKKEMKKGQVVGKAEIHEGDNVVGTIDVVSDTSIVAKELPVKNHEEVKNQISIWWAVGIPWLFYIGYLFYFNIQRKKKVKS